MANDTPKVKEETKRILLSEVYVDFNWNCRQGRWQDEKPDDKGQPLEGPNGGTGFLGLIASLKAVGQDTACDVRPNTKKTKHPYELVTGFRRYEALRRIAEEGVNIPGWDSPKNPSVKVSIRNLTEVEARALNGRENIERDNISTADTAFIIADLGALGMTDKEIGEKIGKSGGYCSVLHGIMKNTKADLLKTWRESPVDPLSVAERKALAELPKGEQDEAYKKLVSAKDGKDKRAGGGQGAWLKTALLQAQAIGTMLGNLEREGLISTDSLDFATMIERVKDYSAGLLRVGKKGATEKQWQTLGKAAQDAWQAAIDYVEPEPKKEEKGKEKAA